MAIIDLQVDIQRGMNALGYPAYQAYLTPALSEYRGTGNNMLSFLVITGTDNPSMSEFASLSSATTWYVANNAQALIDYFNTLWGTSHTLGNVVSYSDRLVDGTFALASQLPSFTQSSESRSLNTAFQISATKGAFVSYSVRVAKAIVTGKQIGRAHV